MVVTSPVLIFELDNKYAAHMYDNLKSVNQIYYLANYNNCKLHYTNCKTFQIRGFDCINANINAIEFFYSLSFLLVAEHNNL